MSKNPDQQMKDKLIDAVLDNIVNDLANGDSTAIAELLGFVPVANLIGYLPEEQGNQFTPTTEPNKVAELLTTKINTQDAEIRRLRAVVACSGLDPDCPIPPSPLTQANDEIERLRGTIACMLDHDNGNRLNYKEITEIGLEAIGK